MMTNTNSKGRALIDLFEICGTSPHEFASTLIELILDDFPQYWAHMPQGYDKQIPIEINDRLSDSYIHFFDWLNSEIEMDVEVWHSMHKHRRFYTKLSKISSIHAGLHQYFELSQYFDVHIYSPINVAATSILSQVWLGSNSSCEFCTPVPLQELLAKSVGNVRVYAYDDTAVISKSGTICTLPYVNFIRDIEEVDN